MYAPGALSNREFEVFLLVCGGIRNKEVADKLCVTEKTVKFHLTNVYKKLNCKSRNEMTAKFYRRDLPLEIVQRLEAMTMTKVATLAAEPPQPAVVATAEPDSGLPRGCEV